MRTEPPHQKRTAAGASSRVLVPNSGPPPTPTVRPTGPWIRCSLTLLGLFPTRPRADPAAGTLGLGGKVPGASSAGLSPDQGPLQRGVLNGTFPATTSTGPRAPSPGGHQAHRALPLRHSPFPPSPSPLPAPPPPVQFLSTRVLGLQTHPHTQSVHPSRAHTGPPPPTPHTSSMYTILRVRAHSVAAGLGLCAPQTLWAQPGYPLISRRRADGQERSRQPRTSPAEPTLAPNPPHHHTWALLRLGLGSCSPRAARTGQVP